MVIRLPRQSKEPEPKKERSIWPDDAVFQYDRFGAKLMIFPCQGVWVKDIWGNIVEKAKTIPFQRDSENRFYYVQVGDPNLDKVNMDDLVPSTWEEDFKNEA